MEKTNKTGGLWNVAISLGAVALAGIVAWKTNSTTALAVTFFLGLCLLVSLVGLLHMDLTDREGLETLEMDAIKAGRGGEALFEQGEVLPAHRSREQFERWFVPIISVVMLGLQLGGAYYLGFHKISGILEGMKTDVSPVLVESRYLGLAGAALLAVILFMRGQFASNLARLQRDRLLQPASDFILFSAYLLIALAAVLAVSFKEQRVDLWVGIVMVCLLVGIALENLLSMIFEIYRPRVSGRQGRLLYRSRLVGLIAKPENLFTTAGKVLDYQFGFKVSETWGYQFLRERLGVLIGIQIIIFWLSTSVVTIGPSERGRLQNLMSSSHTSQWLGSGIHFKLPWPFAEVERFHPNQVHSFYVGLEADDSPEVLNRARIWLKPSGKNYDSELNGNQNGVGKGKIYFPTGSGKAGVSENLIVPSIPVHYRIYGSSEANRKGLEDGWLRYSDPETVIKEMAHRVVSRYFISKDMKTLMRTGRNQAMDDVKKELQMLTDARALGVEILYVGMADLRPPAESPIQMAGMKEDMSSDPNKKETMRPDPVAAVFERAIMANIAQETGMALARNAARRSESMQTNEVQTIINTAISDARVKLKVAQSSLELSRQQNEPFRRAPRLFSLWLYTRSVKRSLVDTRKYIVAVKNADISADIDLKELTRRGMLGVKVPPPGGNN
jgi:hypothetical protein